MKQHLAEHGGHGQLPRREHCTARKSFQGKPMIAKSIKADIVQANARAAGDTGSPEVQVALLTGRIN